MLLSATVVIRGLRLWYFNIRYIFCNKNFEAFLELHMAKDKPDLRRLE